jgi:hypothetical protein
MTVVVLFTRIFVIDDDFEKMFAFDEFCLTFELVIFKLFNLPISDD